MPGKGVSRGHRLLGVTLHRTGPMFQPMPGSEIGLGMGLVNIYKQFHLLTILCKRCR